jgi:colanic acid/amylovoran biosynthesis glycosyltransferase
MERQDIKVSGTKKIVGMVRHELGKPSEPFILDQVRHFENFAPAFIARTRLGDLDPDFGSLTRDMSGMDSWARFSYPAFANPAPLQVLLAEVRSEVVHAHFGPEGAFSVKAAQRLDLPHVVSLYGYDITVSKKAFLSTRRPSLMQYAIRREQLLRGESTFICVSEHIRHRAVQLGLNPDNSAVIPVGVDTTRFESSPLPDEPTIVHVARLVEKKGTEDLLRAFREVLRVIPTAQLVVVGDGPLEGTLRALSIELGVYKSVDFRGTLPREQSIDAIRKGAVFCLPSVTGTNGDQEGLPQVILEAGALGRPVVATYHSGIPEGVAESDSAILVPERSPAQLADALIAVLSDFALAGKMGAFGRQFVVKNFDLKQQTKKLENLYESLL